MRYIFREDIILILIYISTVATLSPKFFSCQFEKPEIDSPLLGCPTGTLFVSQTDPRAHFRTVQDAIISLCDMSYFQDFLVQLTFSLHLAQKKEKPSFSLARENIMKQ